MENYLFWTEWGRNLSDNEFANAFMALGILAARSRPGKVTVVTPVSDQDNLILEQSIYESLKGFNATGPAPEKNPVLLSWRFPLPMHRIAVGLSYYPLAALNPMALAGMWRDISSSLPYNWPMPRLRLNILQYKPETPIRPWFRLLLEADPVEKSVYLDFPGPSTNIYMKWPLRLGYIPGNKAEFSLNKAHEMWPSRDNSAVFGIGREHDNCDFLVFDGNSEQLITEIKKLPVRMKCNLFILRGPAEDADPGFQVNICEMLSVCHANGFVAIRETVGDLPFSDFLNQSVENLSHNLHLDSAFARVLYEMKSIDPDPLIFLGKKLAGFRLEQQVKQTIRKIMMMPPETKIEVPRHTLSRMNFDMAPPITRNASDLQKAIGRKGFSNVQYHGESMGATGLSELHKAMAEAPAPEHVEIKRKERYISARTYQLRDGKFVEEKRALLVGLPAKSNVWIGPREEGAIQNDVLIDITKLPPQIEAWGLTVVLSEPNHIPEPMIRKIELPQDGKSTICEFEYTIKKAVDFEGRITVLHRGRVIQTAVFMMPVVENLAEMPAEDKFRIRDIIPVKTDIGNIKDRSQYDLAIVMNQNNDGKPFAHMYGKDDAWLANLEGVDAIMQSINGLLSRVAESVEDYKGGLKSEKGLELFRQLIYKGCELNDRLIKVRLHTENDKSKFLESDYFQIITTNGSEAIVPFEFIYQHDAPRPDAKLCNDWEKALSGDFDCTANCDRNFRGNICPLGFWGLSKIIERQSLASEEFRADLPAYVIRTEADENRNPLAFGNNCLVAASVNVENKDLQKVIGDIENTLGTPPIQATSWSNWETIVQEQGPLLLIAMPHHEQADPATLEINNDTTIGVLIYDTHVRKTGQADPPIVALLGCDTVGTALQYGTFIEKFRLEGAAIVIGTVATVFGKHATMVADMIVKGLKQGSEQDKNNRMGEIMRAMKRKAMLDGLMMALCVVAFGDADWKLIKK